MPTQKPSEIVKEKIRHLMYQGLFMDDVEYANIVSEARFIAILEYLDESQEENK